MSVHQNSQLVTIFYGMRNSFKINEVACGVYIQATQNVTVIYIQKHFDMYRSMVIIHTFGLTCKMQNLDDNDDTDLHLFIKYYLI